MRLNCFAAALVAVAAALAHAAPPATTRPSAPATEPATLSGNLVPQIDHNATVDTTKYHFILDVIEGPDHLTRYAVKINDVSKAYRQRTKGSHPVFVTGTVSKEGALNVITPTSIDRKPLPIEK